MHPQIDRRLLVCACVAAAATATATTAGAETSGVTPAGFTVTHMLPVAADPARVYQAFTEPQRWWSDTHTWSGQAANLSLDAQAGGCWCERWGNGRSAQHGRVLLAMPGAALRLQAWLGPLQELPVAGVLTFSTIAAPAPAATASAASGGAAAFAAGGAGMAQLRIVYRVAGAADAGLDQLAPAVDRVIGERARRLKAYIETGRPAP